MIPYSDLGVKPKLLEQEGLEFPLLLEEQLQSRTHPLHGNPTSLGHFNTLLQESVGPSQLCYYVVGSSNPSLVIILHVIRSFRSGTLLMLLTLAPGRRGSGSALSFLALGSLDSSRPSRTSGLILPASVTRLDLSECQKHGSETSGRLTKGLAAASVH